MGAVIAATGQLSQTLAQLRRRVAQRFGDYLALTATANGTTTTFVDARALNAATESPVGRVLLLSGGTTHPVTGWNDATTTITFAPPASSATMTQSGATAELFNKRGKGFTPAEYQAAINAAINDAYPLGLIDVRQTIAPAFDAAAPEIVVPVAMVAVYAVEVGDGDGSWYELPMATRSNMRGWRADPGAGQLRLLGPLGAAADGLTLRLSGYARQDELTADADGCLLNAEYVVARAGWHLALSALDKDAAYGQMVGVLLAESKQARPRLRTLRKAGTVGVRSV